MNINLRIKFLKYISQKDKDNGLIKKVHSKKRKNNEI